MNRKIIFTGGLLAVCLIFAILYLQMVYIDYQSEILKMQSEIQKLLVTKRNLQDFAERIRKIPALSEMAKQNLIYAREYLPSDTEQEKFTEEIYRAAEKNSVEIISIQVEEFEEVERGRNFYRQPVHVQFESDYISALNFLREISDGKRFSTLEEISITDTEKNLSCTSEFFIYFFAPLPK